MDAIIRKFQRLARYIRLAYERLYTTCARLFNNQTHHRGLVHDMLSQT